MRLFKIEKTQTHKIIILLGIKIKIKIKNRNTKTPKEVFEYLLKYKNILEKEPNDFEISNDNQNYIWQYWHQGKDNAPRIVKTCLKSVEKYSENQTIKVLDKNDLYNYVELPSYIIEKFEKGIIPYTQYSDIVRCALLVKYGGNWI